MEALWQVRAKLAIQSTEAETHAREVQGREKRRDSGDKCGRSRREETQREAYNAGTDWAISHPCCPDFGFVMLTQPSTVIITIFLYMIPVHDRH